MYNNIVKFVSIALLKRACINKKWQIIPIRLMEGFRRSAEWKGRGFILRLTNVIVTPASLSTVPSN